MRNNNGSGFHRSDTSKPCQAQRRLIRSISTSLFSYIAISRASAPIFQQQESSADYIEYGLPITVMFLLLCHCFDEGGGICVLLSKLFRRVRELIITIPYIGKVEVCLRAMLTLFVSSKININKFVDEWKEPLIMLADFLSRARALVFNALRGLLNIIGGYIIYCRVIVTWFIIGDFVTSISDILLEACTAIVVTEHLFPSMTSFVTRSIDLTTQLPLISESFRREIAIMIFLCSLSITMLYFWNENRWDWVPGDDINKPISTRLTEVYVSIQAYCDALIGVVIYTFVTFLFMPSEKEKEEEKTNLTEVGSDCAVVCGKEIETEETSNGEQPNLREAFVKELKYACPTSEKHDIVSTNSVVSERDREYKSSIGESTLPSASKQSDDALSPNIVLGDSRYLTSKYFSTIEDKSSRVVVTRDTEAPEEKCEGRETTERMRHLKQRKESRFQRKKTSPPPGFFRMRELKRQKELAMRQQQTSRSSSNRTLRPNRKRRSKSNSKRPQHLEEIINGEISDAIPEDFTVCLGSPSHDERIEKFREMFQKEQIASTVKKFLF